MHLPSLAQVLSLSLATLLIRKHLSPKLKWPNDVRLQGKKVSGVLCEIVFSGASAHVILGIGINVNMDKADLDSIDQPATSLKVETGKAWDRTLLLKELAKQFAEDLKTFQKKGFEPFLNPYENLLAFRGEKIHVLDGKTRISGICHSLTSDGRLNLYMDDGSIRTISSGDIS
jgi:BirA family biotin operon repressor/biotin-[acetyl-CoA-carboxylase] ligase